jgi:hypothetical protein
VTIAFTTGTIAISTTTTGWLLHPGGSPSGTQKGIALAVATVGALFAIFSLTTCFVAHAKYGSGRTPAAVKVAALLALMGLLIAILTPM